MPLSIGPKEVAKRARFWVIDISNFEAIESQEMANEPKVFSCLDPALPGLGMYWVGNLGSAGKDLWKRSSGDHSFFRF
jgi:hypothetical protein